VVEKAIIRLTTRSADLRELSKWICGVVLLGTPHRGSKAQKWGAILARAAAAIHYGEHGGPMDAVSEDSSETWDLVDAFVTFMREAGLSDAKAGVVFSETKESNYGRRIGVNWKEMVSLEWSCSGLDNTECIIRSFPENHPQYLASTTSIWIPITLG